MYRIDRSLAILPVALCLTTGVAAEDTSSADPPLPAAARAAVLDYATDGGRVAYHGTSASRLDNVTYVVVVDLGEGHDLMVLLVRRFEDDKGAAYWKASAVDPSEAALLGERLRAR
jgi:hypothetical protein